MQPSHLSKDKNIVLFSLPFFIFPLLLNKPASMEQLYCAVREDEEEEEQQQLLQDGAALKGRQSLQQGKNVSITNAEAPSFFSSVGEQSFPQKEEVLHTHKETNNVVAENGSNFNDDSEKGGNGIIAEIVENVINGEALSSATINADASHHKNSVYFDQQQGTVLFLFCFFFFHNSNLCGPLCFLLFLLSITCLKIKNKNF
ncbi:hypothetical protein V8G54_005690 [Vigna mungo]|uniref:Uncharacterized protein n=1 Tax=Vigna mungo TaxID=3915 RepID=A0AAQ3P1Y5_VIGMU